MKLPLNRATSCIPNTEELVLRTHARTAGSPLESLLLILAAATVFRVVALLTFEGTNEEGPTRVGVAAAWLFHNKPFFGLTDWPEGNYILPALALKLWNNPYWSVRILYAIVSLASVPLVYSLGQQMAGRRSGAVAAWIVAVMPYYLYISTNGGMSEGPYVALILLALLAAVRYCVRPHALAAIASGVSLTLATSFRFDGVMWAIPIFVSLAISGFTHRQSVLRTIQDLSLLTLSTCIFPAVLVVRWTMLYGRPFFVLDRAKANTAQFFFNGVHRSDLLYQSYVVVFWPASTFVLLTPIIAALGWLGVLRLIRQRQMAALPVWTGLVFVTLWLAFAAFKHDILAQWRYTLVLAIVLTTFSYCGAEEITARVTSLTRRRVWSAAVITAILAQMLVTYTAFTDQGLLSRQIGMLSPVRPNQFGSKELIAWIDSLPSSGGAVLLTPHVLEQPYLAMHLQDLKRAHRIIAQSYYSSSEDTYSSNSLVSKLQQDLLLSRYLVTSASFRELGLRDGLFKELIEPKKSGSGRYIWEGANLRFVGKWGSNLAWEVVKADGLSSVRRESDRRL